MHLFHISQVVFIIPRIRPGDKHVTAHRISISWTEEVRGGRSTAALSVRERRTFAHLHTRQLCHLNFSSDKVGLKRYSERQTIGPNVMHFKYLLHIPAFEPATSLITPACAIRSIFSTHSCLYCLPCLSCSFRLYCSFCIFCSL